MPIDLWVIEFSSDPFAIDFDCRLHDVAERFERLRGLWVPEEYEQEEYPQMWTLVNASSWPPMSNYFIQAANSGRRMREWLQDYPEDFEAIPRPDPEMFPGQNMSNDWEYFGMASEVEIDQNMEPIEYSGWDGIQGTMPGPTTTRVRYSYSGQAASNWIEVSEVIIEHDHVYIKRVVTQSGNDVYVGPLYTAGPDEEEVSGDSYARHSLPSDVAELSEDYYTEGRGYEDDHTSSDSMRHGPTDEPFMLEDLFKDIDEALETHEKEH